MSRFKWHCHNSYGILCKSQIKQSYTVCCGIQSVKMRLRGHVWWANYEYSPKCTDVFRLSTKLSKCRCHLTSIACIICAYLSQDILAQSRYRTVATKTQFCNEMSVVDMKGLLADRNYTHPHISPQILFSSRPVPVQFHFHPHPSIEFPFHFHLLPQKFVPSLFVQQSVDKKDINLAANQLADHRQRSSAALL